MLKNVTWMVLPALIVAAAGFATSIALVAVAAPTQWNEFWQVPAPKLAVAVPMPHLRGTLTPLKLDQAGLTDKLSDDCVLPGDITDQILSADCD